ncbi:hypothetical protein CEXT_516781 [Caerostris extrusa]|uniref:Uncharacterized protein n=1 Tax=Caerostris extrusa TaxID=172846 RepID=A0AAV4V1R0_CAEEX|nr:hypothetical protein CEXT_516781 [Caerostris extrusa]
MLPMHPRAQRKGLQTRNMYWCVISQCFLGFKGRKGKEYGNCSIPAGSFAEECDTANEFPSPFERVISVEYFGIIRMRINPPSFPPPPQKEYVYFLCTEI